MIKLIEPNDGKNWARRIINNMEYGRKYCSYSQRMATEVLHLEQAAPVHQNRRGPHASANIAEAVQAGPTAAPEYAYDTEFA